LVGWLDTKGAPVGVVRVGADPADAVPFRLLVQDISTGFNPIKDSRPPSYDAPERTP